MAAEALDIKTLSSLIMATPKTDIEQSVGRILREKQGKKIIVDIIDDHTPFKNQWNKRRQFYKKQNYKIIQTSNIKYSANTDNWNNIYTSSTCAKTNKNIEYIEEEDDDILNKSMGCLIRKK
jgi:superfamily II DNA or RNA helicase